MVEKEYQVLKLLADSWNEYCKLEIQHPDDARDFADAIHTCQRIIMSREAIRQYPDFFYKETKCQ